RRPIEALARQGCAQRHARRRARPRSGRTRLMAARIHAEAGAPRRRPSWEAVGAMTALAALIAGLVFNGFQVRDANRTARETRDATELQLFTQMQSLVNGASFTPTDAEREGLTDAHRQQLAMVGNNMEYLAWL